LEGRLLIFEILFEILRHQGAIGLRKPRLSFQSRPWPRQPAPPQDAPMVRNNGSAHARNRKRRVGISKRSRMVAQYPHREAAMASSFSGSIRIRSIR